MPLKNAVPVALNHCAAARAVQLDCSDGARASRVVARGAHAGVAAPASDAYVNQRVHATVAPAERSPAPPHPLALAPGPAASESIALGVSASVLPPPDVSSSSVRPGWHLIISFSAVTISIFF